MRRTIACIGSRFGTSSSDFFSIIHEYSRCVSSSPSSLFSVLKTSVISYQAQGVLRFLIRLETVRSRILKESFVVITKEKTSGDLHSGKSARPSFKGSLNPL